MLASFAYNYLYGTFVLLLGFVFGPEIFANEFIDLILLVLYVVCYKLVGKALRKMSLVH